MRFFAVALIFFGAAASHAQAPEVPHKMHFANMTLTIRDDARREIQKNVDALTRHSKYFNRWAERAKTYFPLISKIFADENVPDDFKYLALQESALIADAVSVSNAVGFWQFKDFTAISMGMRVDKEIDERMNIASASRGAAQYLKQNNEQFDNWILALQAYQMGAGGVKRAIGEKHNGKRHFEVSSDTYWYIKKFIAHKVAFEKSIDGEPLVKAILFESKSRKSLSDLAKEVAVEEEVLKEYNKWAINGIIPDDKSYVVVIPNGKVGHLPFGQAGDFSLLALSSNKAAKAKPLPAKANEIAREIKFINGLRAIKAVEGESLLALTDRAGITLARFLRFNEMQIDHSIEPGSFYFLEKKKTAASDHSHKVKLGDDLWSISQRYGIQQKKLKKWNRLEEGANPTVGSIVWLSKDKITDIVVPSALPALPEVAKGEVVALESEAFDWEVRPERRASFAKEDSVAPLIVAANETILTPVVADSAKEHWVVKGETLYSIAKLHGVAVMDLVAWNALSIQNDLRPGQKLVLFRIKAERKVHDSLDSSNAVSEGKQFYYEVKESDTLYAIARQFGVTIKDLMDWNDKKELTVKEGEKIRILKK
jgi:membrane-bound lytic murein transglycosylase D